MLARRCLRSDAYHHLHFCGSIYHIEHAISHLRRVRVCARVHVGAFGLGVDDVESGRRGQEAEG